MDTYRVNRYNISKVGSVTNRLVQGAFRYQKLNLSSTGTLTLRNAGVHQTIDTTPLTQLPGSFTSSDERINTIWRVGARTIQMTEIPKNSVPDFWEVTPEGSLVDSLAPQTLAGAVAAMLLSYNLDFEVKPLQGGFGFVVLADTLNSGIYISCDVAGRRIAAYAGSTTFDGEPLAQEKLPTNLTIGFDSWHSIHATVALNDISVTVNGVLVMKFSQNARFFGAPGLGASLGQRTLFRRLSITTPTGDSIYSHPLTDPSFLPDFFMGTNPHEVVVDGSRRDRIAYTGDLDIAGGAALASTHNLESIIGSLDLLGSYQATPGFFIPNAKIQQKPLAEPLQVNQTGLIGYSFNFMTAVASMYMHTGDAEFASKWAPKLQKMLDWADSQTLDSGLFNVSDPTFGGDWNYYDPQQSGVVTKFNVLYAYSLQECLPVLAAGGVDSVVYQGRLEKLRLAIDTQLWSDELKGYYVSQDLKTALAQDSNAIAILAGINIDPAHSSKIIMDSLSTHLMTPFGPRAFSEAAFDLGFQPLVSPYASSYHLRAALASNEVDAANELLGKLWWPMADTANVNYTGTFWETLDSEGRPGLGFMTSLCHGWAAGPTAELSRYVLGVTPIQPGWSRFSVAPVTLGLGSASGSIPTPMGNINVQWRFEEDDMLNMEIIAPAGLVGTVTLPNALRVPADVSNFTLNGKPITGRVFEVKGGCKIVVEQARNS